MTLRYSALATAAKVPFALANVGNSYLEVSGVRLIWFWSFVVLPVIEPNLRQAPFLGLDCIVLPLTKSVMMWFSISVITGREEIQPRMIEWINYWFPLHLKCAINLKCLFNCKVSCISIFQKAPALAGSKIVLLHKWFPLWSIVSNAFLSQNSQNIQSHT